MIKQNQPIFSKTSMKTAGCLLGEAYLQRNLYLLHSVWAGVGVAELWVVSERAGSGQTPQPMARPAQLWGWGSPGWDSSLCAGTELTHGSNADRLLVNFRENTMHISLNPHLNSLFLNHLCIYVVFSFIS